MANRLPPSPGDMLRDCLKQRGWTQEELAMITGKSARAISEVARGNSGISPEMASALAAAFGNTAGEWLQADACYQLAFVELDTAEIERRARLFAAGPIREMQRRGWIAQTADLAELEREVQAFYRERDQPFSVATRMTGELPTLSPAETAWCLRAKQLAGTMLAERFSESKASKARSELKKLAVHPKEAKYLSSVLSDHGIRFVVVEPFAGSKIDGAAFWDDLGPVIAVSIRHDRVDGFWFTVMHEYSHVLHGDPISVDSEMVDPVSGVVVKLANNEVEARADAEAASLLIPTKEIESFVSRTKPLYSRDRIVQFANRIHIHPGIIVGQLQYRKEIGYASQRDLLAKIRDNVIVTALTDGWGQTISPSVTRSSR